MSHESRIHSHESEQAVLGSLLVDPDAIERIGALRPEHLFDKRHRAILAEIMAMVAAGKPVDVITVAEELFQHGHSDDTTTLAYLGDLASSSFGGRNILRYADAIIGKSLERQLLAAADTIRSTVEGMGSTTEKLAAAQSAVMSVAESVARKEPRIMRDVLVSATEILDQRSNGKIRAMPTGFADLDRQLSGGLRPGNVVVIAGRPAMGKTSLAVNVAYQVAEAGDTALILSMEMSEQELSDRLMSQAGSVYLSEILAGNLEGDSGERIMAAVGRLHELPLVIDDQGGLTLYDVGQKARSVKRKHGLSLLVIDYLQLMDGNGSAHGTRDQEIGAISRGIKSLAKELEIPIILLSQLNRSLEQRPNKRPVMSDLRDSGAIEQDADVILFVYRDEVYNPNTPDKGTAEIIVGKARQGQTGMVRMAFQGCYTRFNSLAGGWRPEDREESAPKKRRGMSDF